MCTVCTMLTPDTLEHKHLFLCHLKIGFTPGLGSKAVLDD